MNNISTSECSSGCESGWTTYWEQLSNPADYNFVQNYEEKGSSAHDVVNEDDDDHLSMVSDASSGPSPNLHQNYASSVSEDKKKTSKQKNKTKVKKQNQFSQLDDTATSPVFQFYQDNVAPPHENQYNSVDHHVHGFSQQFSAAHFEEETTPKKHLGFIKSTKKGKPSSLLGRKGQ